MGARSNSIHKWQIGIGTPDTLNLGAIPNVGGAMARIANTRTQNLLADVKREAQKSEARFKEKAQHLDTFNKSFSNLIQAYGKKEASDKAEQLKQQKALESAQERNDQLIASEIASQYNQHMYEQSINPQGFMHTIYRPADESGEGSSCERSLTKIHDDFFANSESFKAASPKVQELVKENTRQTFGRYYNQVLKKDYENRYRYQKNTERNDSNSYLSSLYSSGEDLSGWLETDNIPDADREKIIQMIHHEAELNTIAFANGKEGEDFSDVFEFENGSSYWHPLVRNTPEARSRLEELIKETAGHIVMGSQVKNINAMIQSDNDDAVEALFKSAEDMIDDLSPVDADLLSKNLDVAKKKRAVYEKQRSLEYMNADNTSLFQTLYTINQNPHNNITGSLNVLYAHAHQVQNNFGIIAKGDAKAASEHFQEQMQATAEAAYHIIKNEYETNASPHYKNLEDSARTQQKYVTIIKNGEVKTKAVDDNYPISEAKAEAKGKLEEASKLFEQRLEELKGNKELAPFLASAVENFNKNQMLPERRKATKQAILEEIKAGGKTDQYGDFKAVNYPLLAIQIERDYNRGVLTLEDRIEIFEEAKKMQKFKPEYKTKIIEDMEAFTGIPASDIEKVINAVPEDNNPYENYDLFLGIVDDGKEKSKLLNNKGDKIKLSHDALFSLYAIGYEYYTSGQLVFSGQSTHSLRDLYTKLKEENALTKWTEISNEQRVEYSKQIIENMRKQGANLFMNQSRDYNYDNFPAYKPKF